MTGYERDMLKTQEIILNNQLNIQNLILAVYSGRSLCEKEQEILKTDVMITGKVIEFLKIRQEE